MESQILRLQSLANYRLRMTPDCYNITLAPPAYA